MNTSASNLLVGVFICRWQATQVEAYQDAMHTQFELSAMDVGVLTLIEQMSWCGFKLDPTRYGSDAAR